MLLFSSCATIYFSEPQPAGGQRLYEVPKELYGKWFGETEGWQINNHGLTNINIKTDSTGNISYNEGIITQLSDSFRIYKAKELYIVHSKEHGDYWELTVFKPMKNGDINMYYTSDPHTFISDNNLILEGANFTYEDTLISFNTLNPEGKDSLTFSSAVYSGQMKMKTLRKILTPKNLTVLRKDGTIYNPNDTIQETVVE
jgi:hypothetical protein